MRTIITILVLYCVFAYGYGLSMLVEAFREALDETSEYYKANRPVFLAGCIFFLLWIVFPIAWPLLGIATTVDNEE